MFHVKHFYIARDRSPVRISWRYIARDYGPVLPKQLPPTNCFTWNNLSADALIRLFDRGMHGAFAIGHPLVGAEGDDLVPLQLGMFQRSGQHHGFALLINRGRQLMALGRRMAE